jgi:hypothetical protein
MALGSSIAPLRNACLLQVKSRLCTPRGKSTSKRHRDDCLLGLGCCRIETLGKAATRTTRTGNGGDIIREPGFKTPTVVLDLAMSALGPQVGVEGDTPN